MNLLSIVNLVARVDNKVVLNGVDLLVRNGEVHALMGANGSGKSSLAMTLMGNSNYIVSTNLPDGQAGQQTKVSTVTFGGKDLIAMTADERARTGVYVAWQGPITIPGVSVFNLCKASFEAMGNKIDKLVEFKQKLENLAVKVGLTREHVSRNVNEGFSGGEKKRLELLQLLLLKPKLAILDEIDSGLDSAGVKLVVQVIAEMKKGGTSFILITHNKRLLDEVLVDKTWEMKNGRISAGV